MKIKRNTTAWFISQHWTISEVPCTDGWITSTWRPLRPPPDFFYLPPPDMFLRILKSTNDKPESFKAGAQGFNKYRSLCFLLLQQQSGPYTFGYECSHDNNYKNKLTLSSQSLRWHFEVKNVRHSQAKLVKLEKERNTAAHWASAHKAVTCDLVFVAERWRER